MDLPFDFRLDFECSCFTEDEYENHLTNVSGVIVDADDDDSERIAGSISLYVVDVEGAERAGFGCSDLFDIEAETWPFYETCFDPQTDQLLPQVSRGAWNRNLLILSKLELLPDYRGRGAGLRVLRRCIHRFAGGCSLAVLRCFPLQFVATGGDPATAAWFAGMNLSQYTTDRRQATARLMRHYQKLGFRSIEGTDLMVLNP